MGKFAHNVDDRRHGLVGSWEIEPLDIAKLTSADVGRTVIYRDHGRADVGRTVIYRDHGRAEAGTLTSWRDETVFARYSRGDTSAGARAADLVFGVQRIDP